MRTVLNLRWVIVGIFLFGACAAPGTDSERGQEFVNGFWYTGDGFEPRTMYVVDRALRERRPARVNSTVDLEGGYVVPGFGEAHTHRPANPQRAAEQARDLLEAGVYYVMNQGSLARYRDAFAGVVNRPGSVDALFAYAQIASPQSHSVDLWQRLVGRGFFPGVNVDDLDGDAYFIVESVEELERRWPAILATRPDYVKIMVEHSEQYDTRRDDPAFFGRSGLDPALVAPLVDRAHEAGLRVSAHIETAADFRAVVAAGVDIVAHLPGYDIPKEDDVARYRIDPRDATQAAERGIVVVTTTLLSPDRAEDEPERLARMEANHAYNLRVLVEAGVQFAIGSDQFSQSSVDEVLYLASLGVLENSTLLDLLCSATPPTIFPDRRIGTLEDGAEASFVVLRENPLERLDSIRDIALRVKDGELVSL